MNYYEHHLADYTQATAHLSMLEDAAYSRMLRWYYANEKPLPIDTKAIERLVRAQSKQEREAVKTVLEEFFVQAEDGWHQDRADNEIARFKESEPDRIAKRENEKERQRRSRERRKEIFEILRDHGIVPAYDAPMSELQTMLSRVTLKPVTRDATGTHTPDPTPHTPIPVDTHTQDQPTVGVCVSLVGECCKALVDAGIPATSINQGHPKLLKLIEAGATVIEFGETARESVAKGNGSFAYVLGTMTRRREQAAATKLHQGAMPTARRNGSREGIANAIFGSAEPQEKTIEGERVNE